MIVLDTANKLILTGGSQPICHDSPLFEGTVQAIRRLRVGQEFTKIIDKCSTYFANQANSLKESLQLTKKDQLSRLTDSEIDDLYAKMMVQGPDLYIQVPKSDKAKPILSYACEASNFKRKPPCLRCQHVYSTWGFHKMPADWNERKKSLAQGLYSHLVPPNISQTDWSHCAETAGASKLYLWEYGTLAFV